MRSSRIIITLTSLVLVTACSGLVPTPDEFPQPPWTPIVEFPTPAYPLTSTPRPILKPIAGDDLYEARSLFLLIQVALTAGDSELIADHVLYPIEVNLDGRRVTIPSRAEFLKDFDALFGAGLRDEILSASADDVTQLPGGVQAAGGALWFDQFCVDLLCTKGQFLITQVNN